MIKAKRILVVGCCGSGKSYISEKLSEITGIPIIHLDKLYWKRGWEERAREEFISLREKEMAAERWIIDGNYSYTLPIRLEKCDFVIYMHPTRVECILGILHRIIKSRGRTRKDMADGCPERLDMAFLEYTWNFEKEQGPKLREKLVYSGREVKELRSRRQVREFLDIIKNSGNLITE